MSKNPTKYRKENNFTSALKLPFGKAKSKYKPIINMDKNTLALASGTKNVCIYDGNESWKYRKPNIIK